MRRLEELGIGRPSTYAAIVGVLRERGYAVLYRRRFVPTERGRVVTAFLEAQDVVNNWTKTVEGTPQILSSDATLSGLTASSSTSVGGTYSALGLTPSTFSASTTSYTATVGNATTHVKLTPTVRADSHYERRAFGTLRTTLRILGETFPDAAFELEKPVFEIETPDGSCLPDFLIRARRGGNALAFVIEVMGFERPEYLRGKEVTHPRMATLGTLCTMQASEFDRSPDGLKAEGRKVTQAIRQALRDRWSG